MKKFSLFLAIVMILVMSFGSFAFAASTSFSDVPNGHWAYNFIDTVSGKGAISGYPDGTFKPGNNITVAEFVKIVVGLATNGEQIAPSGSHWASGYMDKAAALGITSGIGFVAKDYDRPITRDEMAKVVVHSEGVTYYYDEGIRTRMQENKQYISFTDEAKCSAEVITACSSGFISGYPDGSYKPNDTASRAEASVVIARMILPGARVYPSIDTVVITQPSQATTSGSKYATMINKLAANAAQYYQVTDARFLQATQNQSWGIGHSIKAMNSYEMYAVFTNGNYVRGTVSVGPSDAAINNKLSIVNFNGAGYESVDYYMFNRYEGNGYKVYILEAENLK